MLVGAREDSPACLGPGPDDQGVLLVKDFSSLLLDRDQLPPLYPQPPEAPYVRPCQEAAAQQAHHLRNRHPSRPPLVLSRPQLQTHRPSVVVALSLVCQLDSLFLS